MSAKTVAPEILRLLEAYQNESAHKKENKNVPTIQVNEVIGYLAFIYEKTRNVVQFSEEYVLRKNTIKRILKRKFIEVRDPYEMASGLLRELVRYRHLSNNSVPESKIAEVAAIIDRYQLAKDTMASQLSAEEAREIRKFLLNVTTSEIDDIIVHKDVDYAFVNFSYRVLNPVISLGTRTPADFKNVQVFMGCLQAFMKLDDEVLQYHLMGVIYPQWFQVTDQLPESFLSDIVQTKIAVDTHLDFDLRRKVVSTINRYLGYFVILRDALNTDREKFARLVEEPEPEIDDPFKKRPESLSDYLKRIIDMRYGIIRSKLVTRSIRAFIYILITKVIVALLIEIPADIFLEGAVNYFTFAVNMIFPLVLILIMAFAARTPGRDNTALLLRGVNDLIYSSTEFDSEIFAESKIVEVRKGGVANAVYMFFYLLLFFAIYGTIVYWLLRFDFNLISGSIFVLLVSVISYFGVILRQPSRQVRVVKHRENVLTFFLNLLSLPILRVGRFLSENVSKINVFVYILDVFIEAPFQILIEVVEDWVEYLRGKQEDIY